MQFKDGTDVYSLDDQHVGRVDRVVLNPKTKKVTDIVVRKGFLITEDKIVPIGLIASATQDRVSLRLDASKLGELPMFEETHYVPVDEAESHNPLYPIDTASALYWYPPITSWKDYPTGLGHDYPPPYRPETEQNIPEGTIALKEGARVFSNDFHDIGNVTQVFTEPPSDRVTFFLISEGLLFKKKLIPVTWIREIQEDEIHLSVGSTMVDKLHEYQEA